MAAYRWGRDLKDVGDQALIRGLDTAFPCMRPGADPILQRASAMPATKLVTDIPLPWSRPRLYAGAVMPSGWLHLPGNSPHKACEFTGDSRADDGSLFALGGERPIACRQPALSFPGDLADFRRGLLETVQLGFSDTRGMTVRPGALDKHMANAAIARLGDAAPSNRVAGGSLTRHQTQIAHQLARVVEPAHVADLSNERHGDDEFDATQRLKRANDGRQRPARQKLLDRRFDAPNPFLRDPDRVDQFLQCDLVGWMIEALLLKPPKVAGAPCRLARERCGHASA